MSALFKPHQEIICLSPLATEQNFSELWSYGVQQEGRDLATLFVQYIQKIFHRIN